jgi:hypothetical protein
MISHGDNFDFNQYAHLLYLCDILKYSRNHDAKQTVDLLFFTKMVMISYALFFLYTFMMEISSGKYVRFNTSEAVNIILSSQNPRCSKVPLRTRCNRAFLIDLKCIKCPDDVKGDMNGVYKKGLRAHVWTVRVGLNDVQIMHKKKEDIPPTCNDQYHLHINSRQNEAGLCRSIFIMYDKQGSIVNSVALLQYHIPLSIGKTSVEFAVSSHGNRKHGDKPFFPTQKSVMKEIKDNLKDGSQSSLVYNDLLNGVGGILAARQPGELPRSRQSNSVSPT